MDFEISKVLKEQIKAYNQTETFTKIGKVLSFGDNIALVYGLEDVKYGEIVRFENDELGLALNLEEYSIGVFLLNNEANICEGQKVFRTEQIISFPCSNDMVGRIVDSLGNPLDGLEKITNFTWNPIFKIAPGVMSRKSVSQPLQTGILVVDALFPIGKGQRELIIGDRQTGKTSLAIDTIINQKNADVYCIYVAIGQKNASVASIAAKLKETGAFTYTTIVVANISENAALQYIVPFSGITLAEFFLAQGKDVLIVYDDLSKHAIAYRTISLLLRRPPGREAYPGDIFYLHSQLLERSVRLNEASGGGSISALPIVETQADDISAYIPTNVISITDGQLFTKEALFNSGQRPAIDVGFSVSRVGSAAQSPLIKQLSSSLKLELAQYNEMAAFAQFGSDVDKNTQKILDHGKKVYQFLKQKNYQPLSLANQAILLFAIKNKFIDQVKLSQVLNFRQKLLDFFHFDNTAQKLIPVLQTGAKLTDQISANLTEILTNFVANFNLENQYGKSTQN